MDVAGDVAEGRVFAERRAAGVGDDDLEVEVDEVVVEELVRLEPPEVAPRDDDAVAGREELQRVAARRGQIDGACVRGLDNGRAVERQRLIDQRHRHGGCAVDGDGQFRLGVVGQLHARRDGRIRDRRLRRGGG